MLVPVNLKIRWFLYYAGFGVALSLAVTFVLTQVASEQIRQQVGANLEQVAFQMADKLERGMFERYHDIGIMADLLGESNQPLAQRRDIPIMLASLQRVYPEFAWLGVMTPDGTIIADQPAVLANANVAARPWFQEGLRQHYVGDLHPAVLLAQLLGGDTEQPLRFVDFSAPVRGPNGALLGVIGGHLDWRWAEQVKQSLVPSLAQFSQADMLVITQQQSIILGPAELQESQLPELIDKQLRRQTWSVVDWDGVDYLVGSAQLNGYRDYPGLQWRVLVREPLELAYAPVAELRDRALLIGSLVALLLAGIGWVSAEHISRPLANLNQQLEYQVQQRTAELEQSNQRLQQLAHTDSLTGLPNHRAFFEHANQRFRQAERSGQGLIAVVLDLDHFKQVNDRYGHAGGDEVLRQVGALLAQHVRGSDMAARTGGEEFSLLLATDAEGALRFTERLRTALEQLVIHHEHHLIQVTMSVGLAHWQAGRSVQQVMSQADEALYAAKEAGRNRCQFQTP